MAMRNESRSTVGGQGQDNEDFKKNNKLQAVSFIDNYFQIIHQTRLYYLFALK